MPYSAQCCSLEAIWLFKGMRASSTDILWQIPAMKFLNLIQWLAMFSLMETTPATAKMAIQENGCSAEIANGGRLRQQALGLVGS